LLVDLIPGDQKRFRLAGVGLVGVLIALVISFSQWGAISSDAFYGLVAADKFSIFFNILFLLICGITILLSVNYTQLGGRGQGEYYSLLLLSTFGYMFMAAGSDLITIFVSLEILSLAVYILSGFIRENLKSGEAAFKYFLLGAFSSTIFLFGIAHVYGTVGDTNLESIAAYLAKGGPSPLFLVAMGMLIVGFGFKMAVVPFHMWTPDVYEGAPTSVTAFMSVGTKAAAFAAFLRVFLGFMEPLQTEWVPIIWTMAVATMVVGNVVAIRQQNIKRMLAYSAIAHAGYILVAVVAGNSLGSSSILYYLAIYSFMNLGAFGVVLILEREQEGNLLVTDYQGLAYQRPVLGLAMAVFLFSLAGIPPTGGFIGKFYLFRAAVSAGHIGLVIIAVLCSAIGLYYYLRVIVYMYMYEPEKEAIEGRIPVLSAVALIIAAIVVIQMGVLPDWFLNQAQLSALSH
jgi:NADH-quinone oxidoreductase subunit N